MIKTRNISVKWYWLTLLAVVMTAGCKDYEAPVFDKINELKVHQIGGDYITLKGKALFKNPNQLSYKVKNIDVDVIYKEKNIANITNTDKTRVIAKDMFEIPFIVEVPTREFKQNMLADLVGLLNGKKVSLNFNGNLTVSKFGVNRKVPVDYSKNIRLKL